MNKESKCLFSISDWINFLNVRAVEFGNMAINKKTRSKSDVSIAVAIIALIIVSLFGMTNVLANKNPAIALVMYAIIMIVFSFIISRIVYEKDKEFEKFFKQYEWSTAKFDTLLTKIMDGELKTSEQIREEYKSYCYESLKKFS